MTFERHDFEHYVRLAKLQAPFTIDASWGQGRSVFGGLSAALVLSHIEAQTGLKDKDLRSLNVHFCAPIMGEENCELTYQVLSQGKSTHQIQGQLIQNGQVKTQLMACFGAKRASSARIKHERESELPAIQTAFKFPYLKGVTPELVQKIDMRLTSKDMPFSGSDESQVHGWMRFEDQPEAFSDAAILALIDAWPPAILTTLSQPAPASTITWNIEFIQPRAAIGKEDHLYYDCQVIQAELGYAHTEGRVYHPNGELLALSRQLVGIYDKSDKRDKIKPND